MGMDTGDIYRPPESDVDHAVALSGNFGSVENALRGEYRFEIGEIISEAWQLTKGSKGVIWGSYLITSVISLAINFIPLILMGQALDTPASPVIAIPLQLLGFLVTYPITVGITLYAVRRAAGDPAASFGDVFSCYDQTLGILGLFFLTILMVIAGSILFVLPGIYLMIALMPASVLLVEKKMGIWESLQTSRKAVTYCWFRYFGLCRAVSLICLVGTVFTLGIGLIWLIPMGWLTLAVAYRNIFGYERARV